jgi:prepilin peptidase CpaA
MNLVVGAPWWLIAILILALLAAAIEDALRLRISNVTCAIVLFAALMAMGVHGFSLALWQNALVCIAILAIGTPAFSFGWLGGGDIKLLAAIGLWLNLSAAAGLIAAVFLAGGLVAIAYIAARRLSRRGQQSRARDRRVPYGVAIVIGALFIFGTQLSEPAANPLIDHLRATQAAAR